MLRWQIAGMVFCAVVLLYTCLFQASGQALNALMMSLSRQGLLFLLVFLLSLFTKLSPVVFVVVCAAAGILLTRWGVRGK